MRRRPRDDSNDEWRKQETVPLGRDTPVVFVRMRLGIDVREDLARTLAPLPPAGPLPDKLYIAIDGTGVPMIPAGTPVEVLNYGRHRAYVKVDGKPMRLGHDYGRDQESLEAWVNKIVINSDPRGRIATYPPPVQAAIREGKVMVGMTREQAITSIGYPLTSENVSLDAPMWRIWRSSHGEYQLNFGADGRIKSVTGDDSVTTLVIYQKGH